MEGRKLRRSDQKEVPMTHVAQIRLLGLGPVTALTKGALIGPPLEQEEMPYSGLA